MTDDSDQLEVYRRRIEADPAAVELVGQEYHDAHPLGRHVEHDPRSLQYAHRITNESRVRVSVRHVRHIPILDQDLPKPLGSCTGNSGTGNLGTTPLYDALPAPKPTLDEAYATALYSDAEKVDGGQGLPKEDEGSSGLSIAKVLTKRTGLISGYTHALSLNDALDALQDGPVMTGFDWHTDCDSPDAHGLVGIGGPIRGGHEPMADEYIVAGDPYADGVIALEDLIGLPNSWGLDWGFEGRFYMTVRDWGTLLGEDGDVTILHPVNTPAPVPTPPGPKPPPPINPTPGGGASFPGSSAAVDTHIARSAAEAGLTISAWLEKHFVGYFKIKPTSTRR